MFGPGLVHSPAGPGPIIWVQVHPYLDLDLVIWGPPGPGPDFRQSRCIMLFFCLRLCMTNHSGGAWGNE